jgi:hypothetical protein
MPKIGPDTVPALFMYAVGLLFAIVIAYQTLQGQSISIYAVSILSGVILYASNSSGVQHGVNVTNDIVSKTAAAIPSTPSGKLSTDAITAAELVKDTAKTTAEKLHKAP